MRQHSICILSLSPIADDPRVRRQAQAFHDAGWSVTAIGISTSRSPAPVWTIIQADAPSVDPEPQAIVATVADVAPDDEATTAKVEIAPDQVTVPTNEAPPSPPRRGPRTRLLALGRMLIPEHHRHLVRPVIRAAFDSLTLAVRFVQYLVYLVRRTVHLAVSIVKSALGIVGGALGLGGSALGVLQKSRQTRREVRSLATDKQPQGAGVVANGNPAQWAEPLPPAMDADEAESSYLAVFEINRMYDAAKEIRADVYLANDWHMLPVVRRLAQENSAKFGYDTHEYAVEEYRYKPEFLATKVPMVRAIEERGLREAVVRTAVSAGIAEDMARLHDVPNVPVEIRNVPNRVLDLPASTPTHRRMRVYFHGIITFDRGLEECIRSVPLWRPEFVFQMRGPIRAEFMPVLKAVIIEAGVWDRVEILPEVSMVDLVHAAASADIGISTPPSTSKHNIYALPNKFFEYIQAGLAMCVADLPDMRRIMDHYDIGVSIAGVNEQAIADAVNSFTPELVDRYKANARLAAAELNWEVEQHRLVKLYEQALSAA